MSATDWARTEERGDIRMMILGARVLDIFGYYIGLVVATIAVFFFFVTGRSSRAGSRIYLERLHNAHPTAVGRPNLFRIFVHHWHFAIAAMDRLMFWQGKLDKFQITTSGREHILAKRDRGILLIGAHMGSFDVMRAFSVERDLPINVVMYRANAAKFNALLEKLNPGASIRIFDLDGSDINRVFELKEALDRGELVALLADRAPPYGRSRMCRVDFMGEEAGFPQNPWILAHMLECEVFLASGMRTGLRRYSVKVEPFAEQILLPRKTRAEDLKSYVIQYATRLEEICAANPYEWFNFYDFWANEPSEH